MVDRRIVRSDVSYVPGYWMHEQSGELAPAVRRYLEGEQLDERELALMRLYLRQWIMAPAFVGDAIAQLRAGVERIVSTESLRRWLQDAMIAGVDPL